MRANAPPSHTDVLLFMPPYWDVYGDIDVRKIGFILPSLGVAYVASYLKGNGIKVRLVDVACAIRSEEEVASTIRELRPRMVGITAVTAGMPTVHRIAQITKQIDPEIVVVAGGPHPCALPADTLEEPAIDLVVEGEGEVPLLELARGTSPEAVPGVTFRGHDGGIVSVPRGPLLEDMDALPVPLFDHLPVHDYGYLVLGNALPVLSARGCPLPCTFCASTVVNQRRYRARSPEAFADEIRWIHSRFGIDSYVFCDDTFTLDQKRTVALCEELLRLDFPIRWSCMIRAAGLRRSTLAIMKRAGCRLVEIGAESGDEEILESIQKKTKLHEIRTTVDRAKGVGLLTNAFFILGLPGETPETVKRTIDFAASLPIDFAQFSMFTPLPGTASWDQVEESPDMECIANDWSDFSRYRGAIVNSTALPARELEALHRSAIRRFYFRPATAWRSFRRMETLGDVRRLLHQAASVARMARLRRPQSAG